MQTNMAVTPKVVMLVALTTHYSLPAWCQSLTIGTLLSEWDPNRHTATQYQDALCPTRCARTIKLSDRRLSCTTCFPCSCDPDCRREGTCCPQAHSDHHWPPDPSKLQRSICTRAPFGQPIILPHVVFVVACDPAFPTDHASRHLCRDPKLLPLRLDTRIPVTSLITQVTYANSYCAACNYDDEYVVTWRLRCRHNLNLSMSVSDADYDQRAVQSPASCGVRPTGHKDIHERHYHQCSGLFTPDAEVTTRCNVTGSWQPAPKEDPLLIRPACEQSAPSLATRYAVWRKEGIQVFANVFCALCNGRRPNDNFCTAFHTPTALYDYDLMNLLAAMDLLTIRGEQQVNDHSTQLFNNSCSAPGQWRHSEVSQPPSSPPPPPPPPPSSSSS
jgi:hypothetical protein